MADVSLTEAARHYRDAAHNLEQHHRTNTARTAEMAERHRALILDLANARAQLLIAAMEPDGTHAPSYHPEGVGTLADLTAGDRVMHEGVWSEVEEARPCMDFGGKLHVIFTNQAWMCSEPEAVVRIQKRSTPDDTPSMDYRTGEWEIVDRPGPPREMRLPGGGVAYQTIRAGEVVPGMWVAAFRPFDQWRQVTAVRATGPDEARFEYGDELETFELDDKVKVASTVDGARMAAERKAMQAEAYDQACEARS